MILKIHKTLLMKKCILIFPVLFLIISSCKINNFVAPNWDVEGNLSFVSRDYSVAEMLKKQQNLYIDSVSNDVVLIATVDDRDEIGTSLKFDGIAKTTNTIVFNRDTVLSLDFDDSSFVRKAIFISGNVLLNFNNPNSFPYSFNLTVNNLKNKQTNQSYTTSRTVSANSTLNFSISLGDYYVDNGGNLLNTLLFDINSSASQQGFTTFDYSVTETIVDYVSGKVKPITSKNVQDTIIEPFGTNAPTNPIIISTIKKSEFIIKNYSESQITLRRAYFVGENKNTLNKIRLLYDFDGNGSLDSFYTISIPRRNSGEPFGEARLQVSSTNSNILQFLGNVPFNVFYERDQVFNSDYTDATLNSNDSVITKFYADIPLRFQSKDYNSYRDTIKSGFTQRQRDKITNIRNIKLTTTLINGIALQMKAKITIADSNNVPLLVLTERVQNPEPDGFVTVAAANVGSDGTVLPNGQVTRVIESELNADDVLRILSFGNVFVELQYITNPNAGLIRVKGDDFSIIRSIGVLTYFVEIE